MPTGLNRVTTHKIKIWTVLKTEEETFILYEKEFSGLCTLGIATRAEI
jgi:hypothetical protein